ncbi:hypothetical protein ACSTIN_12895 [Vibrio parahaemolyticus]
MNLNTPEISSTLKNLSNRFNLSIEYSEAHDTHYIVIPTALNDVIVMQWEDQHIVSINDDHIKTELCPTKLIELVNKLGGKRDLNHVTNKRREKAEQVWKSLQSQ